jgi:threonine dehydrogenase-like Zn-dependent dehydrogenase
LSVGLHAALRRLPQPGERALVVGCGTIGLAVVEALRVLSPRSHITAMARYPQQVQMARVLGADEVIVHEEPYAAIARITAGKLYTGAFGSRMILGGFDVVYDCVGTGRTVQDSLRWTRAGGAVVLTGISLGRMHVDLTHRFPYVAAAELRLAKTLRRTALGSAARPTGSGAISIWRIK